MNILQMVKTSQQKKSSVKKAAVVQLLKANKTAIF